MKVFRERWLAWERELVRCPPTLGSQELQIAIVRKRTPPDLKQHLLLHASSYDTRFRQIVEGYLIAKRATMQELQVAPSTAVGPSFFAASGRRQFIQ